MTPRAVVVAGLVAGLSLLVAGPAAAATLKTEIPGWYDSMPSPQYAPSGPPQPMSFDNSQDPAAQTRYQESFLLPSGSGPGFGQADVQADIQTSNTVTAQLPIAGTPVADAFGTPLEAFAIDAAKDIPMSVSASIQDGEVVLHRADPICKLPDNWRFDQLQVAMLMSSPQGQQQKVMLSVNIQFGDRALAVKAQCAAKKATKHAEHPSKATPTPSSTDAQERASSSATPGPIKREFEKVKAKAKAELRPDEKKASDGDDTGWVVIVLIIGAIGTIAVALLRLRPATRRKSKYENDGSDRIGSGNERK